MVRTDRRIKNWDAHVEHIERLTETPAFGDLRRRIVALARLQTTDTLLDVGAGTGLLALAAAPRVAHVTALDVSPAMCERLETKRRQLGIENVAIVMGSATELPLADDAVDVVVSNYCFHHLSDNEKARALAEIWRVLRPGGRLVLGDMMFGLNLAHRRDRAVILRLVRRMLGHGPAGLLRVMRNAARVITGRGEHPARVDWWRDALLRARFVEVSAHPLDHEGGIASARRPG